jgi:type I restriction-modification system DNA methylase subunit
VRRTAVINQIRGLLLERGITIRKGRQHIEESLPRILEDPDKGAVDAWRGFLRGIEAVDFRDVPADIVGLIFQKLISPEERYRLGQHFTGSDPVDLINSFCIRNADSIVLDPAYGSGSFLVRAYYRKRAMNDHRRHSKLLKELFGTDIGLYPAHLATLNLAAREINDEANYPRIARNDFFNVVPQKTFCELPSDGVEKHAQVFLPSDHRGSNKYRLALAFR